MSDPSDVLQFNDISLVEKAVGHVTLNKACNNVDVTKVS